MNRTIEDHLMDELHVMKYQSKRTIAACMFAI